MITYVKGNLLKGGDDVICHGCNCICNMGAGVALEVKNMSEEELKENCYTMEEFEEKMKKIIDEKEKESDNEEEED